MCILRRGFWVLLKGTGLSMCTPPTHTNTDLLNALRLSRDGPASHVGQTHGTFAWDPEEASSHQEVEKARALGKRIKQ